MIHSEIKHAMRHCAEEWMEVYLAQAQSKSSDKAWQKAYAKRATLQQVRNELSGTRDENPQLYDHLEKIALGGLLYPDPSEAPAETVTSTRKVAPIAPHVIKPAGYSSLEESDSDLDTTTSSSTSTVPTHIKYMTSRKARTWMRVYLDQAQRTSGDKGWQKHYAQRATLQQIYTDFKGTPAEKQEVYDFVLRFFFDGFLYADPAEAQADTSTATRKDTPLAPLVITSADRLELERMDADIETASSSGHVDATKKTASSSFGACGAIAAVVCVVAAVVLANL